MFSWQNTFQSYLPRNNLFPKVNSNHRVICSLATLRAQGLNEMTSDGYIVVLVEGGEEIELESDKEGNFTISSLSSLTGTTVSGLRYLSANSRYRGVRVEAGDLLEPNDGWQSATRVYQVVLNRDDLNQERDIRQPYSQKHTDGIAGCNLTSEEQSHHGRPPILATIGRYIYIYDYA